MKPNMTFAVLLGMALVVGSAFGQTMVRAQIPFDFTVGNSTLPAGEYVVSQFVPGDGTVMEIRSANSGAHIYVQTSATESAKAPAENKLVFRRYGDQYFLSQIWNERQLVGRGLPISDRERELARGTLVQEASIPGK